MFHTSIYYLYILIITGLQDQHKIIDHDSDEIKSKRVALSECQQTLADGRLKAGRPDDLNHMSLEQLQERPPHMGSPAGPY